MIHFLILVVAGVLIFSSVGNNTSHEKKFVQSGLVFGR
jgi:hypothetical protein